MDATTIYSLAATIAVCMTVARWWRLRMLKRSQAVRHIVQYDTLAQTKETVFNAGWLWPISKRVADVHKTHFDIDRGDLEYRRKYTVYDVELWNGTRWLGKGILPWGGNSVDYSSKARFYYASLDLKDITAFLNARRVYGLTVRELANVCYVDGVIHGDALRHKGPLWPHNDVEVHVMRKRRRGLALPDLEAFRGVLHL